VEIAEQILPVIFWRKELRPGSGGMGRTRGGHGQIMEVTSRIDQPFELLAAFDRIDHPPRGADGGRAGQPGRVALSSGKVLAGKGTQLIPPGETLILETPGGGGLGDEAERDPALRDRDAREGLDDPAITR